jgi:alpha-beta hydrolase superfamily lysophospholipase
LKIVAVIYILVGVALYFLQDKFLFHPTALPSDYFFHFDQPFEEKNIQYDNSTRFNIVRFIRRDTSLKKGAVIYCHGNMDNITHYAKFVSNFTKHGYEVWMMDYPGFGKSTGDLNEELMYRETLEVYKMVRAAGWDPDHIIIYGKSLGTGIAAHLASIRDCKRLILESPYYNVENLVSHFCWMYPTSWMIHYKIPTNQWLQKVTAPVTIFHGSDDGTIPFSNAEKLKAIFKPGDELIPIQGGHHNDLNDSPLMKQKLDSLLELP